jgi:AraC-like DNA-binding protein
MPSRSRQQTIRSSPNLGLSAATDKSVTMHPRHSGEAHCPFLLAACGFNFDPPKQVFREYLASIDELVIWRYVVDGSLLWDSGDCRVRVGPGTVLATHQPAQTSLVVSSEGACVLWVLCVGKPAIAYFDLIISCFGRTHYLPSHSEPVKRAEELVRLVRANRPRSPFFWSEQCYLWLSAYHRHMDTHKTSLKEVVALPEQTFGLLPGLPRTVKSFAVQLGYSPSHFSRQLARKWKKTPGLLLRELRLREASRLLLGSSDRVQDIAAKTGYQSVPAFITAFKRLHGKTPLEYRHAKR